MSYTVTYLLLPGDSLLDSLGLPALTPRGPAGAVRPWLCGFVNMSRVRVRVCGPLHWQYHFINVNPPDTELAPVSRTIGEDQLVDEMVFKCTHTVEMDWLLPGVPPTGKRWVGDLMWTLWCVQSVMVAAFVRCTCDLCDLKSLRYGSRDCCRIVMPRTSLCMCCLRLLLPCPGYGVSELRFLWWRSSSSKGVRHRA